MSEIEIFKESILFNKLKEKAPKKAELIEKVYKTFEDEILIPKIMGTQKNDFFVGFIKNLSSLSRKFL